MVQSHRYLVNFWYCFYCYTLASTFVTSSVNVIATATATRNIEIPGCTFDTNGSGTRSDRVERRRNQKASAEVHKYSSGSNNNNKIHHLHHRRGSTGRPSTTKAGANRAIMRDPPTRATIQSPGDVRHLQQPKGRSRRKNLSCPTGYRPTASWSMSKKQQQQQCVTTIHRELPIRQISITESPSTTKRPAAHHVLVDRRLDTKVTLSTRAATAKTATATASAPKAATVLIGTGQHRRYQITKVRIHYRSKVFPPVNQNNKKKKKKKNKKKNLAGLFRVKVYGGQENKSLLGSGILRPFKGNADGHMDVYLRSSRGIVPSGNSLKVVFARASGSGNQSNENRGTAQIQELSIHGDSAVADAAEFQSDGTKRIVWGACAVVDFADRKLEDYAPGAGGGGGAFRSVLDVREELDRMEEHWEWTSRGRHRMEWVQERVTVDQNLSPTLFNDEWWAFRDHLAQLIETKLANRISHYDSNRDGVIDHVWFVVSAGDHDSWSYLVGGRSQHGNTDMFVDVQGGYAVQVGCTGCFNHEVAHGGEIGLPDLYGPKSTVGSLSLLGYSWEDPPGGLLAFELNQLQWTVPQVVSVSTYDMALLPMEEGGEAILVHPESTLGNTDKPREYFMLEYHQRPVHGWGSGWSVNYNGIVITHVYEDAPDANRNEPPLVVIESPCEAIPWDTWPTEFDLWYATNPCISDAGFQAKYYNDGNNTVFTVKNFRDDDPTGTIILDVVL